VYRRDVAGASTDLQRVTSICLAIYHLHDILAYRLSRLVSITPVVCSANAILANVKVLGVVNVLVRTGLNAVDDLFSLSKPQSMCGATHNALEALGLSGWLAECIWYRRSGSRRRLFDHRPQSQSPRGFRLG
jgi:hypothetical protein